MQPGGPVQPTTLFIVTACQATKAGRIDSWAPKKFKYLGSNKNWKCELHIQSTNESTEWKAFGRLPLLTTLWKAYNTVLNFKVDFCSLFPDLFCVWVYFVDICEDNLYRDRILGRNWDKRLKSFSPRYSVPPSPSSVPPSPSLEKEVLSADSAK